MVPRTPWYMIMHTLERYRWIGPVRNGDKWERRLIAVRSDPVTDWVAVPVEWLPEMLNRPICDFPQFWSSILCVSRSALSVVGDFLRESGEILELSGLDGGYTGFHCLQTYDALDIAATDLAINAWPGIAFASPSFVPTLRRAAIGIGQVFRIKQSFQKIFVSDQFRVRYESASLTGLDFLPVPLA